MKQTFNIKNAFTTKTLLLSCILTFLTFQACTTSKPYARKHKRTSSGIIAKKKRSSAKNKYSAPKRLKASKSIRHQLVNAADKYKGIPYRYGGKHPDGFDCSGFITYIYKKAGYNIYGNSRTQSTLGKQIPISKAKAGDLIFFGNSSKIVHVAIVSKQDAHTLEVIHSTSSRGVVRENIKHSTYWQKRMLFASDVITKKS